MASRPLVCDICSSSRELGHRIPLCLSSAQDGLQATSKGKEGENIACGEFK